MRPALNYVQIGVAFVVALLLAATLIPNYQRYQARAHSAEARIALAAIFTAEKGHAVDTGTYSICLRDIGYRPDGYGMEQARRFYAVGFGPSVQAPPQSCTPEEGRTWYDANARLWEDGLPIARGENLPAEYQLVEPKRFKVAAAGSVGNAGRPYDIWVIDEEKILNNVQDGYTHRSLSQQQPIPWLLWLLLPGLFLLRSAFIGQKRATEEAVWIVVVVLHFLVLIVVFWLVNGMVGEAFGPLGLVVSVPLSLAAICLANYKMAFALKPQPPQPAQLPSAPRAQPPRAAGK